MYRFSGKLEAIANIAVIVVAVLFGLVLIQKSFFPKRVVEPPMRLQPAAGTKLDLSGEDWSKQTKTLILALQTTCHFCNESAPFYKRIVDEARDKNIKLVAVLPSAVEESEAHLRQLGLGGIEVKSSHRWAGSTSAALRP